MRWCSMFWNARRPVCSVLGRTNSTLRVLGRGGGAKPGTGGVAIGVAVLVEYIFLGQKPPVPSCTFVAPYPRHTCDSSGTLWSASKLNTFSTCMY